MAKISEQRMAKIMSEFLDIQLTKEKLEIFGKQKEFDLVNREHRTVGDIKRPEYRGIPSGVKDSISRDIWLMEKLEASTGEAWKKIIVGWGNRKIFDSYADNYDLWLGDVEIYFIDNEEKVHKIR